MEPDDDEPRAVTPPARRKPEKQDHRRQRLDHLFNSSRSDMTADELRRMMRGRRPALSARDNEIVLEVHADEWDVGDYMWEGLAVIINDWGAGDAVRAALPSAVVAAEIAGFNEINDATPDTRVVATVALGIHAMFMRQLPTYPDF
jgi:hypothetical protein